MNTNKKSLMKFLAVGLLFAGCSSVAHLPTVESTGSYAATSPKDVRVYATADIDSEYVVLGQVVANADAGTNANIPVNLLKKEASSLGADAIIDMRLEIDYGYMTNAIKATGTAVKLK